MRVVPRSMGGSKSIRASFDLTGSRKSSVPR